MRKNQKQGLSNFAYGAIVLTVVAIVTFLGFNKEIPFRHHYTIKAAFTSANNIRVNSPVRIAGVNIGKVVKVQHIDGKQAAMVSMRIDKKGLPIHTDARLRIRPRIFLEGNFFVDIEPGSPSAPIIGDGDTIPINQTAAPVQLDQVLTTLQKDTRRNLQGLLGDLNTGFSGKGALGYNRSIRYWTPAYRDGAVVADASRGILEHDLSGYVAGAGAVAQSLDADPDALKSLLTDFNTSFGAFASRSSQLEAAVAELPRTLAAGLPALAALNAAFPPLRRLIPDLRAATRSTGPAIDANLPLVRQLQKLVRPSELRGLVADLRPTVPALAKLNNATIPLYQQVRAASSCQNQVVLPWSRDKIQDAAFPATGPVYQDSLKLLPGIAGESRVGSANGQWFRVLVSGGLYATPNGNGGFMLTGQPLIGANPPKVAKRPPLREDVPCETQDPPDLRSTPTGVVSRRAVIPNDKLPELHKMIASEMKGVAKMLKQSKATSKLRVSTSTVTHADILKLHKPQ